MDRRQIKTRRKVYRAFTELLAENPYSRITVQDILDRAHVSRSAFYAHFDTREDLLRKMCADLAGAPAPDERRQESRHSRPSASSDVRSIAALVLHRFSSRLDAVRILLSCECREVFADSLLKYLEGVFTDAVNSAGSPAPREYLIRHLACDLAETVCWWAEHPEYTSEEIEAFFLVTAPCISPESGIPASVSPESGLRRQA